MKSREEIEKEVEQIESIVKEKEYCEFSKFSKEAVQIFLEREGFNGSKPKNN